MKIAVCTPCYDDPKFGFVGSLVRALAFTREALGATPEWLAITSTHLAGARQILAEQAIEKGADFILWADVDHIFPEDAIVRLVGHDRPVVGCNYVNRRSDGPTAGKVINGQPCLIWSNKAAAERGPLEQVQALGLGLCLVRVAELQRVPKPWFESSREDAWFFHRLEQANVPVYVDHALSLEVGHIDSQVRYFQG